MSDYLQVCYLLLVLGLLTSCKGSENLEPLQDGLYHIEFTPTSEEAECSAFSGVLEAHNKDERTWLKTGLYVEDISLCPTVDVYDSTIIDLEHCRETVLTSAYSLYSAANLNGELIFLENAAREYNIALGLPVALINEGGNKETIIFEGNLHSGGIWQGLSKFSGSESCTGFWRIK